MKIDAERLRGFLDCMHDEADEREKHSAQIRAIVTAAKEAGYDTKAVRKVFNRERMDEAERSKQDDLLETYEGALGGKGRALQAIRDGVPVGEAAEANGVHRATLARARSGNSHVAKQGSNATPHTADGVVIEGEGAAAASPVVSALGTGGAESTTPHKSPQPEDHSTVENRVRAEIAHTESCGGVESRHAALALHSGGAGTVSEQDDAPRTGDVPSAGSNPETEPAAGVAPGPQDTHCIETPPTQVVDGKASAPEPPEIDLTIPDFLRRPSPLGRG